MAFEVFTAGTPNGKRPLVLLEVLGVPFKYTRIDIFEKKEQLNENFFQLNPYGKIPAIKDIDPNTGKEIIIFESGAILQFLISKYDPDYKYHYSNTDPLYWEQVKWFTFTVSTVSPQQGELSFHLNFSPQKSEFPISRARKEVDRIYTAIESRLQENNGWLVGDKLNIADISLFPFIRRHEFVQIDVPKTYPHINTWLSKLENVEGFEKGYGYS